MTDIKIENGDIVLDSSGNTVMLNDSDAYFQQAVICISSSKGGFVYNRDIGCELEISDKDDAGCAKRAELAMNEAVARLDNVSARVTDISDNTITVELTVDNETRAFSIAY